MSQTLVVKVGTKVLTSASGELNLDVIRGLASHVAKKLMAQGIEVRLGNGTGPHAISELLEGKIGTSFIPALKMLKAGKRRIAHSDGLAKGTVTVDARAGLALTTVPAASLLPVGITRIEGDFDRGDILEILDESGRRLGFGRAETGSTQARTQLGQKHQPALIHFDHMFIE